MNASKGRKVYRNSRYSIICREWAAGAFIFDLHDNKNGKSYISYSDNLQTAINCADNSL